MCSPQYFIVILLYFSAAERRSSFTWIGLKIGTGVNSRSELVVLTVGGGGRCHIELALPRDVPLLKLFSFALNFFFNHLHIDHVLSFSVFLSYLLSSVPLSLLPFLPSFSPGCVWWGPEEVGNKRQQNYLPADFHRNAEGENCQVQVLWNLYRNLPCTGFQTARFCVYVCVCPVCFRQL